MVGIIVNFLCNLSSSRSNSSSQSNTARTCCQKNWNSKQGKLHGHCRSWIYVVLLIIQLARVQLFYRCFSSSNSSICVYNRASQEKCRPSKQKASKCEGKSIRIYQEKLTNITKTAKVGCVLTILCP